MVSRPSSDTPQLPDETRSPLTGLLKEALQTRGLRATATRLQVLKALLQHKQPLSHQEVTEALLETGMDRATVYRNLMDLTQAGLLIRSDFGDKVWRFSFHSDWMPSSEGNMATSHTHAHFVCTDCNAMLCLPEPSMMPHNVTESLHSVASQTHSDIAVIETITLRGLCRHCHQA